MKRKQADTISLSDDSAVAVKSLLSDVESIGKEAMVMNELYKTKQALARERVQSAVLREQINLGLDSSYEFAFTEMVFKKKPSLEDKQ